MCPALCQGLITAFDIDTAVGVQLDILGLWIGRSRIVSQPISGVYFSWDTDGLGYDRGIWQGPYDPDSGYTTLSDETYRIILKAKIAINNWDGRNDSLPPILEAATAGSGLRMQIVDNRDMTISVWVFPETDISDVSLELIAAIKQGYLTVKAAGVWAGDVETPSVEAPSEGSKFFGFDMDNEYIGGSMLEHGDNTLMATNNFKPFATAADANVMSQADWEALPALCPALLAGQQNQRR